MLMHQNPLGLFFSALLAGIQTPKGLQFCQLGAL